MSLKDVNPVNPKHPKRVAIVLSNPAISPTTGWPVGFWWSELTHPYFAFTEKGYEVDLGPMAASTDHTNHELASRLISAADGIVNHAAAVWNVTCATPRQSSTGATSLCP
jgi:putative intracellular protease/amidase